MSSKSRRSGRRLPVTYVPPARAGECPHCGADLRFPSRYEMTLLGVSDAKLAAAQRHPAGRLLTYWACPACGANGAVLDAG